MVGAAINRVVVAKHLWIFTLVTQSNACGNIQQLLWGGEEVIGCDMVAVDSSGLLYTQSVPDSEVHGANMGPTWGPPGAYRTQVGPMLGPWTLQSGVCSQKLYLLQWSFNCIFITWCNQRARHFCIKTIYKHSSYSIHISPIVSQNNVSRVVDVYKLWLTDIWLRWCRYRRQNNGGVFNAIDHSLLDMICSTNPNELYQHWF